MAPGAPRGKRKVARGGSKNFSRNLRPLSDEEPESIDKPDSEEEEESSEDESSTAAAATGFAKPESREERKAAAKARKEAAKARLAGASAASSDDDGDEDAADEPQQLAPRKQIAGTAGIKVSNPNDAANAGVGGLSRREREALEAAAAKERYWKLQEAGKTDQARADMARLAKIRAEREEKARQRKAELEEKKREAEEKAQARGGKRK